MSGKKKVQLLDTAETDVETAAETTAAMPQADDTALPAQRGLEGDKPADRIALSADALEQLSAETATRLDALDERTKRLTASQEKLRGRVALLEQEDESAGQDVRGASASAGRKLSDFLGG